jgi:hypothetical protein
MKAGADDRHGSRLVYVPSGPRSCGHERRTGSMPKLIATHEVDDVAHWLASPRRAEVFGSAVTNIRTFVDPQNPNRVGLSMDVSDMDAFQAVMASDEGAAAMKHDGVRPETLVILVES